MYKPSSRARAFASLAACGALLSLVGALAGCGATAAQLPTEPGCPEAVPTLGAGCTGSNRNSVCEYRDAQDQLTVRECREDPTRGTFVWQAAIGLGGSSGGAAPPRPPPPPPSPPPASNADADAGTNES